MKNRLSKAQHNVKHYSETYPPDASLWYKNAVSYEEYIRAYRDSNADDKGDFAGLTEKTNYLQDLGVDCIWILPQYPCPLKDDGYDIADYYGVHSDYGTLNDFKILLVQ